jgi:hypothetical protein
VYLLKVNVSIESEWSTAAALHSSLHCEQWEHRRRQSGGTVEVERYLQLGVDLA